MTRFGDLEKWNTMSVTGYNQKFGHKYWNFCIDEEAGSRVTTEEKESIIKRICDNISGKEEIRYEDRRIVVTEEDNGTYVVVDGIKRTVAIRDFLNGKITYEGKFWNDLSERMRYLFREFEMHINVENY